jgi:hypothetical protein
VFCPRCGAEYREGFTTCADCDIPLTQEPPPPPPLPEYVDYVPLLSTFNVGDIAIIRAVLDDEEVKYFFEGECFNIVRPLVQPARLLVRRDQVEAAANALKGLKLVHFAFSNIGRNTATFVSGLSCLLNVPLLAYWFVQPFISGRARGVALSWDLFFSGAWFTVLLAIMLVGAYGMFSAFRKAKRPAEE